MVLGSQEPGRVGRRRSLHRGAARRGGSSSLTSAGRSSGGAALHGSWAAVVSGGPRAWSPLRAPAGVISTSQRADRRRARGSGSAGRAMYRRGADLGPGRHRPWTAPAAEMTGNVSAMRVPGRGGGRGTRGCLTQRDELQGRIHGPAHQLAERALLRATAGHQGEHVFANLRRRSDGKARNERLRRGSRGPEPNRPRIRCNGSCGRRRGCPERPRRRGAAGPSGTE
jgi:hypothetical protein